MDADSLGDLCRVHFRVKAPVKLGQVIGLSGSSYALGSFNRLQVLSLVTTPEAYPIWYTVTPVVIPRGEVVRYKYCVLEAGVVKAFEKIDQPRIVVTEELDNIVEDELSLQSLENSNQDSEMQLFDEIVRMKRRGSEHDRLFDLSILSHGQRLFLVCYHLPIEVHRSSDSNALFTVNWTDSLIAKSRDSIANDARTQWMGTVSVGHLKLVEGEMEALTEILQKMDCIPVFLDDEVAYDAYKGFCKQIMWPIFHNVDQIDQIHAAWNLPSGYGEAKSGAADGLVTKTNISHVSSSRERWAHEGSKANSETWTKQQSLDKESSTATEKVVEWNKNEKKYHAAYQRMNEMFYETLQKHIHENDVVWVHDYHLMLLPKLLRGTPLPLASNRKDKEQFTQSIDCKIVFFLHIPFPTSQIFRTLPNANELLHSMTCADVVGFHAFDHTRHFLNAIKRMLGIRSYTRPGGLLTVMVQDREVIVTMSHVSIEPDAIDKLLIDPETLRKASEIREKYKGRRIIVGVDTCQRLNGVAHKLAAFDRFLADYSGERSSYPVLLQWCVHQNNRPEDEATTSADLHKLSTEINEKYGKHAAQVQHLNEPAIVVDYREAKAIKLSLQDRVALWLASDVILLTHIREGLNLLPLEYIYARKDQAYAGVVVISEFSTCSSLLNGSIKINPFSSSSVADAIDKALSMSTKNCNARRARDLIFVSTHPSSLWTKQILGDLDQLHAGVAVAGNSALKRHHDSLTSKSTAALNNLSSSVTGNQAVRMPEPLDFDSVLKWYEASVKDYGITATCSRVCVFDYGGVLLQKEKYDIYIKQTLSAISGRRPSELLMRCIKKLSEDPRNVVMVVTGLTKMKLGDTFRGMKNVTVVSSNGLVYSWGDNMRTAYDKVQGDMEDSFARQSGDEEFYEEVSFTKSDVQKCDSMGSSPSPKDKPKSETETASILKHLTIHSNYSRNTIEKMEEYRTQQRVDQGDVKDVDGRVWEFLDENIDWTAVSNIALPIMTKFTFRTNGTCKTPRIPGIGWSYFGADPEWGEKQAAQLKVELEAALANYDVKVISLIQGSIEVVPRSLHKGILVKRLLERVTDRRAGRLPNFCMIVGDEDSDDFMYSTLLSNVANAGITAQIRKMKTFTVNVMKRATPAQYYLNSVSDVENLVQILATSPTTISVDDEMIIARD